MCRGVRSVIEMSGLRLQTIVFTGYEAFPDETGEITDLDIVRTLIYDHVNLDAELDAKVAQEGPKGGIV